PATTEIYTLSLHDALPIFAPHLMKEEKDPKPPKIHDLFIDIGAGSRKEAEKLVRTGDPITLADEFDLLRNDLAVARAFDNRIGRSEEHTSELQSPCNLVCR